MPKYYSVYIITNCDRDIILRAIRQLAESREVLSVIVLDYALRQTVQGYARTLIVVSVTLSSYLANY